MYYLKGSLREHGDIIDKIKVESFKDCLEKQADDIFEELIDNGIAKKDKIAIIGHSQGGLRGYALYKKYYDRLSIIGLFTLSSPWGGVRILDKIPEIKSQVEKYYSFVSSYKPEYSTKFKECLDFLKPFVDKSNLGVSDLKRNSQFFQKMKSYKVRDDSKMSIYALGGEETDIFKSSLILHPEAKNEILNAKKDIDNIIWDLRNVAFPIFAADVALWLPLMPFRMLVGLGNAIDGRSHLFPIPTFSGMSNEASSMLEEMKTWTDINKKLCEYIGSKEHDGILSLEEQLFDFSLEEKNTIVDEFLIEDAYHGPTEYPENKSDIKKPEKLYITIPKLLNI